MVTATETLTINLPIAAAQRLRRVAEISGRALDDVIADTLRFTLPPLLEDVPAAFHAELANLETLTTEQLRRHMADTLDTEVLARYDTLLAANADGMLDEIGQQELGVLRAAADALMFRKAYAALLLRWRGERIPTLAELEAEHSGRHLGRAVCASTRHGWSTLWLLPHFIDRYWSTPFC